MKEGSGESEFEFGIVDSTDKETKVSVSGLGEEDSTSKGEA